MTNIITNLILQEEAHTSISTRISAALPLLLVAALTAIMAPMGERLVAYRLRTIYPNTDGVVFAIDLYTTVTLAAVVPVLGLVFVPKLAANASLIAFFYVGAFLLNLVVLILLLTTRDHHSYVSKRLFRLWSYGTVWGAESPSELSGDPPKPATISRRPCSSASFTPASGSSST